MFDLFQSAYRTGHSTVTAVMKVHNDNSHGLDNRGVVVLVLLDLSEAFDTVDHGILLETMRSLLGVEEVALDWFTSYLSRLGLVIHGPWQSSSCTLCPRDP